MSTFPYFFMLLFFLTPPHFQPRSSAAYKFELDGVCKYQCDKNRQFWHADRPYEFKCNTRYTKDKDREKCRLDCEQCPAHVCDEFEDANTYSCPPIEIKYNAFNKPCRERCERNRPYGRRESYILQCGNDVSDVDGCYTCDGGVCPKFVCDADSNNADRFCPAVQFEKGVCQDRCDRHRRIGQVSTYELYCSNQPDESTCERECSQCPSYVCNPKLGFTYACPTPYLSQECKEICEKHRPSYNNGEYVYYCTHHMAYNDCKKVCQKCPEFFCDIDDSYGFISMHCPKKEEENIWTYNPPNKRHYKGKCKNRCDKNRGGGPFGYDLQCKNRYESRSEIDLCINDCRNECPSDSCENSNNEDRLTIKCKPNQREVDKLKKEREDEIAALENEHERRRNLLVIWLIILGILLAIVIAGFVTYICYTRRRIRTAPVPNNYTSAVTVNNQQHQNQIQYMPANAQILQRQNKQNANVNGHQPQPQYPIQSNAVNSASTPTFQIYPGQMAPSMAKSTPTLSPPVPAHPPAGPSPHNAPPPAVTEPPKNQAKQQSQPEPPQPPAVDNRQNTLGINSTQNKPKS